MSDDGLSPYRVATVPRDTVPLGSCTGSSPTELGYAAADAGLERLRGAADLDAALEAMAASHRERLRRLFELPDARIVLAPSGTDVLYTASSMALVGAERVHHVVVGASELGGGTLRASRGLSISPAAPFGASEADAPLEGLAGRCAAEPVYLRDRAGQRYDADGVDEQIAALVDERVGSARVVLHMVVHSKTGLRAPSAGLAVELLERHGDRVMVLVDAAQGRLAPRDVRHAIELGFVVMFTGSKFYGGPPFSGCLVLPPRWAGDPGPLAPGMRAWAARADLPRTWSQARASLTEAGNPGMLLRWEAALAEMEAYHAIAPRYRGGVYHAFAAAVHEAIGPSRVLDLDLPRPPVHQLVTALGAYPSVFGFTVRGAGGLLGADALRELHRLLDTDLGHEDPALGGCYHLGQPVALGPPQQGGPALLRVALGGPLVTRLARTPDAGAAWLRGVMQGMRTKAERLVQSGRVPA